METRVTYNEESKAWEIYEPYTTIDCKTEKDFQFLQNAIEHYKKRGRWIPDPEADPEDPYCASVCSLCGRSARIDSEGDEILTNYCDNCGAKMDGEA